MKFISPAKKVLLCCLFLILFLAVPIASQAQTAVPTAPSVLNNPTVMAPCGLPASWAVLTSSATVTTFNMTADCVVNSWDIGSSARAFMDITSGTFTINGNGYRIIGPDDRTFFIIGATLNLNNVTIQENTGLSTVGISSGGTLNASGVIFQDNTNTSTPLLMAAGARATLNNVQFLNNTAGAQSSGGNIIIAASNNTRVEITNAVFRGNTVVNNLAVIEARDGGAVQISGCVVFESNVQANGNAAASTASTGPGSSLSNTSVSTGPVCLATTPTPVPQPKKKKKANPTPAPTSTPRPQIAATHVALQAATGATFGATFGLDSGVHFRQLDGAGIGIQSLIDAGFLEAFDVWGYVEQGVEVCFSQTGRVVFLDARTSPRAIVSLESTVVNGQTCVSINSPGSLVLLPN